MADEKDETLMGGAKPEGEKPPASVTPEQKGDQTPQPKPEGEKPAGGKSEEGTPGQKKDEPAKGAPEKYADFTLPEGVTLDVAAKETFVAIARELDLSQEKAQKLVDLKVKLDQNVAKEVEAQHKKLVEGWKGESLKALGAEADKSLAVAAKARDKFGSPEFVKFMEESGLGNHPAFIDFCLKVGKAISEDNLVEGKPGSKEKTLGEVFYGSGESK